MQTEIEAKFLDADHENLRKRLKELGAVCKRPNRLTRRKNYDFPDLRLLHSVNGWVRVRDEGDKVTLSYKQVDSREVDGTKEVSLVVDDFDEACLLLERIGMTAKSYQETRRESWTLGTVEIELDEWPWIRPFVEVEAKSEADLFSAIEKLGFTKESAFHGSVEIAYMAEYNVGEDEINSWPEIKFGPVPASLEKKRK